MRYIKIIMIVIFLLSAIIFTNSWYKDKKAADKTYPEIQIDSEQIEVSVKEGSDILLKDVSAYDEKDGDLTNRVVIESISKFVDKKNHICNVTYAVADSDNNVSKKTRKIKFKDYESPKFTLSQPLCFDMGSDTGVTDVIGAIDDRDGDISNKVRILSSTVRTDISGEYTVTAQATNSMGDTAKLKTTVVIRQGNNLSPVISLKEDIVCIKTGDEFNPLKYIDLVKDHGKKSISNNKVEVVSSSVNTDKAGCYLVEYSVKDSLGNEGSTYLTVVVED